MGVTLEEPHVPELHRCGQGKHRPPLASRKEASDGAPGRGKEILCCEAQKSCLKWGSSTLALMKSGVQPLLLEWGSGATPCIDGG